MSSRKPKDKNRRDRESRGDSTKNLVEIASSAIVDQSSSSRGIDGGQTTRQPTLRRGESDDYYHPRPDTLPGPGYVESPTHYSGPPPHQPSYNGAAGPGKEYGAVDGGIDSYTTLHEPSQHQNSGHNGAGHGGYTGGGPIYHAGYGEAAPAHYSQHAGAMRPPMQQQGASAEYYHGSGSYSQPPNQPHQHVQSYNVHVGVGGQGQMTGAFPPTVQHPQSAPQSGYGSYTHPVPTQGQKPPRRDSSSSSSSSSYVDISRTYPLPPVRRAPLGAIRTFFTAPSESRRRVIRRKSSRTLREQRRQGRLAQGRTRSASSSEADSDLAYGSGYLRRRKRGGSRGSRSPKGRRYTGSRSPRRYDENGRRGSVDRDKVGGSRENFQPAAAGGVPLPGLGLANTMPGTFPIDTLVTAGAAGAIAAGLSRKDSKKSKRDAENEILKLGEDLHNLAKTQNKYDLEEAAKRGRYNVVRHNEGRHGLGPKGLGSGGSLTRGIPSSKPARKEKEDDGWETSDSDNTSSSSESADSAMAFGGENTYQSWKWREPSHPPRHPQSHQSQNQTRDQHNQHYPHPPTRKSTIVDPKLFGPQNSLLGVVETPVGFGNIDNLRGDGPTPLDPPTVKQTGYFRSPLPSPKPERRNEEEIRLIKAEEKKRKKDPILMRDGSSRQGKNREMQHVFPMPTEDPGFVDVAGASVSGTPRHDEKRPSFHARTDSLPLRAPKPMSPVRREVYDSPEVSSKKGKGNEKDEESSRSNDIALGGLAGAAIAAGIAYGMSSPETERHTSKSKSKGKSRAEDEPEKEIDSRRMFEDDMARRNGRRPKAGPHRRDSYGFSQQPISAASPMTTREATGVKVDPFQFQVNDDAWESSNGDKKGKMPMPAHERMAARAAGSFRDSGSSTPRKYQQDIDRDKRREAEYQKQLYSSSPEMRRHGDSGTNRQLERTDSGRTRDIGQAKPFHERIAARAAESNPDTGRSSPRTSASALDEEAERRIREVVQKWGILGRKGTGFADVVLAAKKAELEKVEPVYETPAPEIKMVERAPKWATESAPTDYSPEPGRTKERSESPPPWRVEDELESPTLTRVKGEDAPPVVRQGSSDADYRYAGMHDDYFSSRPNQERPRERHRGRSRTRSPSPPKRGGSRTRSRSVVRERSPSPDIMEARAPKNHDRRPHNTEHEYEDIVKEADQFTAPLPAQDIIAAVAAIHADENRHPHDPNHPSHDEVQEEADRYWREMELARKLAKQHDNDPTPRVITPPAMDHHSRDRDEEEKRREKGPYAEPDADFRFDHEMHPHELPLFTPVALRKSFSLPEDFDDTQPFDPSLLGLKRPLLNIVRATPKPDENAKVTQLKEPRSRSQSRERNFETSRFVPRDDEKPTYGKPVEIEDEPSSTSRKIADISAITEPEAHAEAEKSVSWGENDTQVYVPITPYDEARNPHDGSIPSTPEATRAAPGSGLPHSRGHEHHKEETLASDCEKRGSKDKGKGKEKVKEDAPEKRPKPKSLWSRFTPDLAKRIQEREELAYNLANASTIGFADGDEGREVPREEVASLALERGRRFQDPEVGEEGHHHHHHKESMDPELEKGEAFVYKGVVVEPEPPRKHKKKSRKHRDRTPSPPAIGPKPASPSGRMPGSFDSDTEVAFARPRGISPPASDVSTVIYHQPSELSDSAGIATGFNSEIGIRPRGLSHEESFVDIPKPASSNESFEIVEKHPEETMVVTVEAAGEKPESFAVVDFHSSLPSEETQPLIVDARKETDGPLGDREVLATPATEDEGFVTPLAEVVTPFDATAAEDIPAPTIVDAGPFLGGSISISSTSPSEQQDLEKSIDASMDPPREVDTSAPVEEVMPLQEMSTETEASSSSNPKKKKTKGKKGASFPLDEPAAIEEMEMKEVLKEAAPKPENATLPSVQEVAEDMKSSIEGDEASKEIVVHLVTPAIEGDHDIRKDKDTSLEGENTSTISPPLDASAEVVASEVTGTSRSIEPSISPDDEPTEQPRDIGLADEFTKSDSVTETGGVGELGVTSAGVAPLDIDTALEIVKDVKAREEKQDKKKKSLFDSDFAAVALAGTSAAVAGIANALIPSTSSSSSTTKQDITNTPATTKEFIDEPAKSWVAPEMPTGLSKKQKKAWEKKVHKEREDFESAKPKKEVGGEHWSASIVQPVEGAKQSSEAPIVVAEPQPEIVDASAPVVDEAAKDDTRAPPPISVVEPLKESLEPTPEAGEAASYYNPSTDVPSALTEPIVEASKDITKSPVDAAAPITTEEITLPAPALWEAPEMPAGLNKKAKKAWTLIVAKEKEEWEAAQASAAQTPAVLEEKNDEVREVSEPVGEPVDAQAPGLEEGSKGAVEAPAAGVTETNEKPIEIIDAPLENTDARASPTDMVGEASKDIVHARGTPVIEVIDIPEASKDITNVPAQSNVPEVIEPVVKTYQEAEMPTGLSKKQKTAWKKKVTKEREEFETAQASKVTSAEASGVQSGVETSEVVVEDAGKDIVDASAAVVEESSKEIFDASAASEEASTGILAAVAESSKDVVGGPVEVIKAAPASADTPAPSIEIVQEASKTIVDAPAQPPAEVIDTAVEIVDILAPSMAIISNTNKDIPSAAISASAIAEIISAPDIEVYEEPTMPTGLNKKQKQAWKKKVAREKEEWESAKSSAEGSTKESGVETAAVVDAPPDTAETSKNTAQDPTPTVEDTSKNIDEALGVAVTETVDQPIMEAVQPSADGTVPTIEDMPVVHEAVSEQPATVVTEAPPSAPHAAFENFENAVRALHDATSEPAITPVNVEESSKDIIDPPTEAISATQPIPEVIATPLETPAVSLDSSAENSAEPPKKMNKRERKAWDKAQREATAAKASAHEEASALTAMAADTPDPVDEAPIKSAPAQSGPIQSLETPQLEVPELLPTPVFEDESGAFATAPPETPLATPLETPLQVEQASDSPTEGDTGVVSLSMEDATALAASDPEAQAGDVSISIEDAAALAGEAHVPTRKLSKKEKKAAEKAARAREMEGESSTATDGERVKVPVDDFKELVDGPAADNAAKPLKTPLATPAAVETPAAEMEVSLGGKKKKKKKGKGEAADTAEAPATEIIQPAVEQRTTEPVVDQDPVAETLALLSGISHTRALPLPSAQQSIEPISAEQTIESPTDDDDAFHSAAEDRARSATPTGTVDDDDFHSTNGDGAWHSPRMHGHDQAEMMVPEMGKETEVMETEVTEDITFALAKGKKKKKKKSKNIASGSGSGTTGGEDSMTEGDARESFLANAGTLGAGVGSAAAGPRDMNSGILESEERNADAAGRWESQPISEVMRMVQDGREREEEMEGTVVGHHEGGDVLAGQTMTWERKEKVGVDPVEETRRVLEGIEHSSAGKEWRVVSDPLPNDQEIMKREIMPGIDPQFGDLLPLPPRDSPPNEEVDAGALVTDLPPTPAEAPVAYQPLYGIQEQAEPSELKEEILTIDPEIHPRSIRPAIDPQFGDLLELPPSQPGSPLCPVDDDAISMLLPESPPESPAVAKTSLDGVRERDREIPQTPRKKDKTFAGRSPSVNAVPLKFLLGGRPSSNSNPSSPVAGSATSPTRPKSRHSWDSSKGLQPLTLLSGMERRHSRGSSLAEFESRSLATLLESASKDNMSTADTAVNTVVEEQAIKTDTDGEGTDAFFTAVSVKHGKEYLPPSALTHAGAPSTDVADLVIPAPSAEVVEQSSNYIMDATMDTVAEAWQEPEMPTGLNKKQKTAWKKKVAKEKEDWQSARSSPEQSESQAATAEVEPTRVLYVPAPIVEESSEVVDAPVGAVKATTAPTSFLDVVEETSRDIDDAPTHVFADITEAPPQPATEEAVSDPVAEIYIEPEMPSGLNKKQKTAWKKKVAKEKEDWQSARSVQSSAEQSSGGWTDSGDQKQVADDPTPQQDLRGAVEQSREIPNEVELEVTVEPMAQPASDIVAPPTSLRESEPQNVDLESVLQQLPAIELPLPSDGPLLEASKDITNAYSPEEIAQLPTALVYEAPEMPTGMNKKQKKAWEKKNSREREERESAQSSAEQTGNQTPARADAPMDFGEASAPFIEEVNKLIDDAPAESTGVLIEVPIGAVEMDPEATDAALLSKPNLEETIKDIVDEPSQPATGVIDMPINAEAIHSAPEIYIEPEIPTGLNKKQKTAWKKKIAKEKEEWESAQSSAAQTDDQTLAVVEETKDVIGIPVEVDDVPAPIVEESCKGVVDAPAERSAPVLDTPLQAVETAPEMIEAPTSATAAAKNNSQDIVEEATHSVTEPIPKPASDEAIQPQPEAYKEPEMPSDLNKKQKTAWKKKIAKEREEFESAQASGIASGVQKPALEDTNKVVADTPVESITEAVEVAPLQETPKLEIGGFIETPVGETSEPIFAGTAEDVATHEPITAQIEEVSKNIVDTPIKVASELTTESPAVDDSQPAKKLNKKQKAALAKKLKAESESATASTSGGWTDPGAQTPAEKSIAQPIIEKDSAKVTEQPIKPTQHVAPTSEQPSSGSVSDFDAAVRALHDKSEAPIEAAGGTVDVMSYLKTPAESETPIKTMGPASETPLEILSDPVVESTSNARISDAKTNEATEIKNRKETINDIIEAPDTKLTAVFISPEMPIGLNKKQKRVWESMVQKEREKWESTQASKEERGVQTPGIDEKKSAEESDFSPSATGFSPDAIADELLVPKTEPVDPTIYDVSDPAEQPSTQALANIAVEAPGPQSPALALPAYEEGGGEAAEYFGGGLMGTPPRADSPKLKKSLHSQAQIVDEEQLSESAGEKGDVDSSAFETTSSKKKKKKKKGKEVAVEEPIAEVQSPVLEMEKEQEKGSWGDEMDDDAETKEIAAPTMLPAIVKGAFSRPHSPELKVSNTTSGKKGKKKKGNKGASDEVEAPATEPSTETVGIPPETSSKPLSKCEADKSFADVPAELEQAEDIKVSASAAVPLESDSNDSPPTPDAVRETLALLGGISYTREPVIKISALRDIPAEVTEETAIIEQPKEVVEDAPATASEAAPANINPPILAAKAIEMPTMPNGLNKKQKKAWEKKIAAFIAKAEASQAASAAASSGQPPAFEAAPAEVVEESIKEIVDPSAPEILEKPTPIESVDEKTAIPEVNEALCEFITEPSPMDEASPTLGDVLVPDVSSEVVHDRVEPEVAKDISLPETPLETAADSAFESASTKKKEKKSKRTATVETETEPETVVSTLHVDAPNVLESGPPSDSTKDAEVIEASPAIAEDAPTEPPLVEGFPEILEGSPGIIDNLEPSIARSVPLPDSSGDVTPAEISTESETTSTWEEPEMPKGLNKKKKAEWKKKMAKEKEEWESDQGSAAQPLAKIIEHTPVIEAIEAPIENAVEKPTRLAESVVEIGQPAPNIDDTPADAPIANTPKEPATITDDFERSIARNVTLPDSALATPMESESPFESSSSKQSNKKKTRKNALVVEEESSSPATQTREKAPKDLEVIGIPAIEIVADAKEAIIEPTEESLEVVEDIKEATTSAGAAAESCAEASRGITESSATPIMETIQAPAVEDAVSECAAVWEEPTIPTGLNKKKREAWKKKVAKEKEEWESAQASKAASAAEGGAQTPIVEDRPADVVEESKADVEVAETAPILERPMEEPTPAMTEDSPTETSNDAPMDGALAEPAIVIEEGAKDIPLPETPLETAESSAFESVSSSKSKKRKKGKKGAVIPEEEPASPAPELIVETLKDIEPILKEPIDRSVDVPAKDHVVISEPVLHDAIVEVEHPTTPLNAEYVDVSVSTHEESAAKPISADNSGAATPFVDVSINESNNSSSDRTPDLEKAEEPMENTEAPKTAFLEHSASGNGSSLPRELQEKMEQQVLVSEAGAGGVESYGDEETKDVGEEKNEIGGASGVVNDTVEREMPGGLNKKQKKAWEKAEKKRIEEASAAADDAKALEDAANVEVEEVSEEVVDEPLVESVETAAVEEVDEWNPTRKMSKKEQKTVDKKRSEEKELAEMEAEAKKEQDRLAAIEEQIKAPSSPVEAEETSRENVLEPEAPVENIMTPQEIPAEDEWSAPTRKLSKKEQKAANKKRRQEEEEAELYAALKSEQELAEEEAKIQEATTPITEDATREIVEELPTQETETPVETPAEGGWPPARKLSKKEKKALDNKRRDADEHALFDAAAAATATAAAIATVVLATGEDRPASPPQDVEERAKEKQVDITTPIEESSKLDSGTESPPANTKVKRRDKGKGKAIEIVDRPWSMDPKTPTESKDRSISMENQPPQVMNVRTASPDCGIFQQALEKVVEKQVQQRDLQEKIQENITAQAVKGSWSFSSLEDDKEENTPWSASRLPPVLEEDVVLEQPRTPDDATRSRSPIYRGIDKEDSAYVEGAESPKPRPRSWFDPEYVRDSGVLLRERKSSDSQKSFSERAITDEALVRRSWPLVDDGKETVDLRRKKRLSHKDSHSSPYEKITPKDIAKAATGLGITEGHKRSLSKSPALSESPSREFLLRKANRSQTSSSDEKHSTTLSRQSSGLRDVGRSETTRSASDRQHQRQSSLVESLHNDSPRSFSDNINNPRTRTPSGISREEYYNRGLSATPTSERGASGLGPVLSRPGSVISNRSVTPSLRRVSGRASTDLRAASQLALATTITEEGARAHPRDADSGSASDNKPSHQGDNTKDKNINTSDVSAASDTRTPAPNEGKKRMKGMAEVYVRISFPNQ